MFVSAIAVEPTYHLLSCMQCWISWIQTPAALRSWRTPHPCQSIALSHSLYLPRKPWQAGGVIQLNWQQIPHSYPQPGQARVECWSCRRQAWGWRDLRHDPIQSPFAPGAVLTLALPSPEVLWLLLEFQLSKWIYLILDDPWVAVSITDKERVSIICDSNTGRFAIVGLIWSRLKSETPSMSKHS